MDRQKARASLSIVMLVTLLGSAGIALPYPVLAPYFMGESNDLLLHFLGLNPKVLLGIALATYPLGLLIGSSIIGPLSDRYGRKKTLIYTLGGSFVGYLLTALAISLDSFLYFCIARLLTGFFEGNISVARAIAVELHPHIDRTKALSLLYSTGYAGWLIGPLAGGYLMAYGIDMPFLAGSCAVFASMIFVILVLEKTPPQKPSGLSIIKEIRANHSVSVLKHAELRRFIRYYFVFTLGINAFYEFYPLWLVDNLKFDSKQIGWTTVIITSLMILVSVTIADKIPRKFGEKRTLFFGNLVFDLAVISVTFLQDPLVYLPLAITGAAIAIINVVYPSLLSEYFGHLGQGRIMGLQVSIFCLTNVIIALVGGFLATLNDSMVMWTAALLIIGSIITYKEPSNEN